MAGVPDSVSWTLLVVEVDGADVAVSELMLFETPAPPQAAIQQMVTSSVENRANDATCLILLSMRNYSPGQVSAQSVADR